MPQKAGDPSEIIKEAAKVIGCGTNEFRNRSKIGKEDKEKRDSEGIWLEQGWNGIAYLRGNTENLNQ